MECEPGDCNKDTSTNQSEWLVYGSWNIGRWHAFESGRSPSESRNFSQRRGAVTVPDGGSAAVTICAWD
eukprot:4183899-Amphidinium_carterae.1